MCENIEPEKKKEREPHQKMEDLDEVKYKNLIEM